MNRRDFLRNVALAAFAARFAPVEQLFADDSVPLDDNIVAILSDTHIRQPENTRQIKRFNQVLANILAMNPRPARLLIYGDVARSTGEIPDYELFKKLIKPIEDAGIKWDVAMGNHDRLENYAKIFPERVKDQPVKDRLITIVETPHADFILLDSYLKDSIKGTLDDEQKSWLEETLKKYTDKPVFVGCHHPLRDTHLWDLLKNSPKCAAYLHGHYHYYRSPLDQGVPTICFPSVGHWGDLGFMIANITEEEAVFTPHIDAYLWSKWGYVKEPEKNVEEYMAQLNANSPVIRFK